MKLRIASFIAAVLILSGCATVRTAWGDLVGTPADRSQKAEAKVEAAEVKVEAAKAGLVDAAHIKVAMAELLSRHIAEQSKVADSLRTTISGAKADLDIARGALPPDELVSLRQTVDQLRSTNTQLQAAGEQALALLDQQSGQSAAALRAAVVTADTARARADKADAAVRDWGRERDATARKWDRMWLWIWLVGGLWIAAQLLPLAAKFIPVLAPAATVFSAVVAPAATRALSQAKALGRDASAALHNVMAKIEEKAPAIVTEAQAIRAEWITPEDGTAAAHAAALREANQI